MVDILGSMHSEINYAGLNVPLGAPLSSVDGPRFIHGLIQIPSFEVQWGYIITQKLDIPLIFRHQVVSLFFGSAYDILHRLSRTDESESFQSS
jgi:hypothetical protein